MQEFEGFVKMSRAEYNAKAKSVDAYGAALPYQRGDMCFHNGRIYISAVDNNRHCPAGDAGTHWKQVMIED